MKTPPAKDAVFILVRVRGPQPLYDVDWSRNTLRVFPTGQIFSKVEVKCINHKGVKAVRSTGWRRIAKLRHVTPAEYREQMLQGGFVDLEVK